jgi:hypothetical protein
MMLEAEHRNEGVFMSDPTLHVVEQVRDAAPNLNGPKVAPPQKPKPPKFKGVVEKQKPTRILPSTRISFPKQIDLLRGYAAASGPSNKAVTADETAAIVGMQRDTLSLINPFFVDVGFLQRVEQKNEAWRYLPSADVINFARAYEWNKETAAHKLAPSMAASWFGEALLKRLSFGSLDEEEAISVLAEAASAAPEYKAQLRILLNYLSAAGLAQLADGRVTKGKATNTAPMNSSTTETPHVTQEQAPQHRITPSVSTAFLQPTQGVVNFHVDVKIDMAEFASWSPARITAFFAGVAQVLAAKGALEKEVSKEEK